MKGRAEQAIKPVTMLRTDMGPYMACSGIVTVSEVGLAAVTVPFTVPNNTLLFPAVALKPLPAIVMDVPGTPLYALRELTTGCATSLDASDIKSNMATEKTYIFLIWDQVGGRQNKIMQDKCMISLFYLLKNFTNGHFSLRTVKLASRWAEKVPASLLFLSGSNRNG